MFEGAIVPKNVKYGMSELISGVHDPGNAQGWIAMERLFMSFVSPAETWSVRAAAGRGHWAASD